LLFPEEVPSTSVAEPSGRTVPPTYASAPAPSEPETYTSEEYRSWIVSRQSYRKPPDQRHKRRVRSTAEGPTTTAESIELKTLKPSPGESGARAKPTSSSSSLHESIRHTQLASSSRSTTPKVVRAGLPDARATLEAASSSAGGTGAAGTRTSDAQQPVKDLPLTRKPLKIRPEEFRVHAAGDVADPSLRVTTRGGGAERRTFSGLLYAHIYCGHGLKTTRTTLRDLYCVVSVDGLNKARTAIRTGAINFDWDEDFEVELDAARRISFSVYNWDPVAKQKLCFASSVTLDEFLQHGPKQRLALRLEPAGTIYLDLVYKDLTLRFQRKPAPDPGAIFGGELQAIVAREGIEDNVPVVVRRSVEEVERRGMESVGLYRLCGSAKRQAQLKAELEQDARNVDLSPRSIPDTSVITGD